MSLVQAVDFDGQSRRFTARLRACARLLALSFAAQWLFYAVVAGYGFVSTWFIFLRPDADLLSVWQMLKLFVLAAVPAMMTSALLALAIFRFHQVVTVIRPDRPIPEFLRLLRNDVFDPRRYIIGLPLFLAVFAFMCVFGEVKANIPIVSPFAWDEAFMELDRWLHFGRHPWEILQPVLGFPLVSFIISKFYAVWLVVMWMVWMWLAFDRRMSHLRSRFFVAYMLIWMIGGGLLAIALSSAGPVYYGNLGLSPDPFAGLMAYLHDADKIYPIEALTVQSMLWDAYTGKISLVAGISAMPSMHNATALLFVLAVWPVNRKLGIALAVFAFIIFIGSIHLGWHYAVDTYLAYAVTLACWWCAGYVARWNDSRPAHVRFAAALEAEFDDGAARAAKSPAT